MAIHPQPSARAVFTVGVLKRMNAGRVDSFDQRLRSQKIQYLAQLFRVSPPYSFSIYLRGPYSSPLAGDLFAVHGSNLKVGPIYFVSDELRERLRNLEAFVAGKNNRELEILTTWHWLLRVARMRPDSAKAKVIGLKGVTSEELRRAETELRKLP